MTLKKLVTVALLMIAALIVVAVSLVATDINLLYIKSSSGHSKLHHGAPCLLHTYVLGDYEELR